MAKIMRMKVLRKENEGDRTLLYAANPIYHVIADPAVNVEVGDTVEFKPYGVNFGWFLRVVSDTPELPEEVVFEKKPTIPEVLPLAKAYYAKPGNSVGGSLHIVLDDGNVKDKNVEFCLEQARLMGDEDGIKLAGLLLRMSKTQRYKIHQLI